MRLRMGRAFCGVLPCVALAIPGAPTAPRQSLTVYAAASLNQAFGDLGDTLERRIPGLTVTFNFAGSQQLALQIEQGAPVDVFASADERWMDAVRDSGLVGGPPTIFAHNRLVVITPAGGSVRRLQDLARPGLRLVLAAAAVPVGRYARQALGKLSRLEGFAPDFGRRVLGNVVSDEEDVKAVAAKVQLGEADAGIVYVSDITPEVSHHVRRIAIPDAGNVVADYPVAVLRGAPDPRVARAFVRLLLGPVGQRVLEANGFIAAGTD